MKTKALLVLTVLLAACMICSCGGGSGSGSESAQKAVAVNFDLNIADAVERIISASSQSYEDVEFWYRAIPKWESSEGEGYKIQGDTRNASGKDDNNFVKLTDSANNKFTYANYNSSGAVGYFAQGRWEFDLEVRKSITVNTTTSYAVLWKTTSPVVQYINAENKTINFTLHKNIDATQKGTVQFNITAPKTANTDYFEVYYSPLGSTATGDGTKITTGLTKGGDDGAITATLTGSVDLASGNYAITVKYFSNTNVLVGASTVAAEVIPGGDISVTGSIENNKWQQATFSIKGMYKLCISVTAGSITDKGTVSVADTGTVNFSCAPTLTELDGSAVSTAPTYFYEWRVNGSKEQSGSGENAEKFAYALVAGDANSYLYVDCITYFMDGTTVIGSASETFRLIVEE